jgi:spore coat protein SA
VRAIFLRTRKQSVAVLLSGREKFGAYYGGALARWTYEVYRRLEDDIEVAVFGFPTPSEDLYPVPHYTSSLWRLCKAVGQLPLARRYEEALWLRALASRIHAFDAIHIHNRPQWVKMLRNQGFVGAIILHLQNDHLGHWTPAMLGKLANQVDAVGVCSRYLRDTFAPNSPPLAAKTHVVFNGVNVDLFTAREEVRESKTILFVGRFDPDKGVLQLVQAYARLLTEHPDARLVICGTTGFGTHEETPYVRAVHALAHSIEENGRGAIHFPGYIHHDRDLPGWFQRATVFASPSLFQEPFGLVNAEAMACATVVVGSPRGGIPEVLGDAGRLANPEDVEQFAGTISSLLGNPEQRQKLCRASYTRARSLFDWSVIAPQWLEIITKVVKRRQDPRLIQDMRA